MAFQIITPSQTVQHNDVDLKHAIKWATETFAVVTEVRNAS